MQAEPELEARALLEGTIARQDPSHVFALFSGGHDSLCSTHLASRHPRFSGVVHVNTEIGIEGTRQFARDTCKQYGWPLLELRPPRPPFQKKDGTPWGQAGQTAYEAIVHRWGFPSPKGHTVIYNRLKERCLRALVQTHTDPLCAICRQARGQKHKRRQGHLFAVRRIVFVTGVRRQESKRRMGHIVAEQQDGRRVWCAPLVDWDDEAKRAYRLRHDLPTNDIARRLCMSGECCCGAFAKPEELAEINAVCPETAAYIRRLEAEVAATGQKYCRWGIKPPSTRKRSRKDAPGQLTLPLCHSCEARQEEEPPA